MKVLTYIEMKEGKISNSGLELISAAKTLGEGVAVLIQKDCEEASKKISDFGIDTIVMEANATCEDDIVAILKTAVDMTDSKVILLSATQEGKDIAPRLAASLETGCVTDVTSIVEENGKLKFTRPAYGGTILENLEFTNGKVAVASIRSGSFLKPESGHDGKITKVTPKIEEDKIKVKLIETTIEIAEMVNLEGADVIVAGGRGCGNAETFKLVEKLAELLGGVVGASRPAIEEGWVSRDHQIGQSGKIVAPKLYIGCGISGAMQHASGIVNSDYIVAINKDADASIFDISDIGIVGRCEDILPIMIEEIRKRKA